ncbi:MAG: DUF2252 family protein [Planctomycetes bacterium]|nr:DUF2252 family protein [Planctomycetota bacterium]
MNQMADDHSVFDEIVAFNSDRDPDLVERKLTRLSESAFTFFRGTDHLFGKAWPALKPNDSGPAILCCGDLHADNFGAYQTEEGEFRFDINDFDEALFAPCSFDLVRCTASLLLAGEEWHLSPLQTNGIALAFLDQYRAAVTESLRTGVIGEIAPGSGAGPVWKLLNATASGTQAALLEQTTERGKNGTRRITPNPDKYPKVSDKRADKVREAIEAFGVSIGHAKAYRVLDVSGRIAGVGGLGLRRYAVLIDGGAAGHNRLLDVKEARPSCVLPGVDTPQVEHFPSEAQRIVSAQRRLQAKPLRGLAALEFGGRAYRLREMIPEESRSNLKHLQDQPGELRQALEVVGQITGWSHLRGARPEQRPMLARWAEGAGMAAVLAAAVRFADQTLQDFTAYQTAFRAQKKR